MGSIVLDCSVVDVKSELLVCMVARLSVDCGQTKGEVRITLTNKKNNVVIAELDMKKDQNPDPLKTKGELNFLFEGEMMVPDPEGKVKTFVTQKKAFHLEMGKHAKDAHEVFLDTWKNLVKRGYLSPMKMVQE